MNGMYLWETDKDCHREVTDLAPRNRAMLPLYSSEPLESPPKSGLVLSRDIELDYLFNQETFLLEEHASS